MKKIFVLIILLLLVGCTQEAQMCSEEQIKEILTDFNITLEKYEFVAGKCSSSMRSKAELKVNDNKYELYKVIGSAPNHYRNIYCFKTNKKNDPLFQTARNKICDGLEQWGFDEHKQCREGYYDMITDQYDLISLAWYSTPNGNTLHQLNESCIDRSLEEF